MINILTAENAKYAQRTYLPSGKAQRKLSELCVNLSELCGYMFFYSFKLLIGISNLNQMVNRKITVADFVEIVKLSLQSLYLPGSCLTSRKMICNLDINHLSPPLIHIKHPNFIT